MNLFFEYEPTGGFDTFSRQSHFRKICRKDFIELWCTVKHAEYHHIYHQITSIEQHSDV